MAFLWLQLITDVWDLLCPVGPGPCLRRAPWRGPALGTKEDRPPRIPTGLKAECVSPEPPGPPPWSARLSGTAGSASCLAISSPGSPQALRFICTRQASWPPLGGVGHRGVTTCSCATQTVTLPPTATELQAILEVAAHSTSFLCWPRLQTEVRIPSEKRRILKDRLRDFMRQR